MTPAEGASVRARSLVGSGTGGALRQDDGAVASEAFNRRRRHLDPSSHTSPARLLEASSSFVLSGSTPSLSPSPMPPAGRSEAASGERVIRIQGGRPFGDVRSEALRQCSPLYDPFRADTLCPSGVLAGGAAPHSSSHSRGSTAGATATSGSSARMISQSPSGEDPTSLPDWRQMPIAKKLLMGESLRAASPSLAAAAVAPAGDHRIGGAANGTRERDDPFVSHATNGYQAEWLPHGATPNTDIPRILVHTPLAHHTTAKVHPVQQQQRSTTPVSYLASGKNSIQAAHGREERREEMEVQGMEAMDMQGNRCANVDFGLSPKLIEEEDTPWHQHPGVGLETVLSDSGMR